MRTEERPGDGTDTTAREVVTTLAGLERRAGSPGERQAAHWLAERLRAAGSSVSVDEVQFLDGYAALLLPLGLIGIASGVAALAGRRRVGALAALLAAAALIDDVSNGTRLWRRLTGRRKRTWNVVGECGDQDSEHTLVVLAHHDAAQTGLVFDPSAQRWLARQFPGLIARTYTSAPLWWPVVGGPMLAALGALTGRPRLTLAGTVLSAGVVAIAADVARSPIVPGANDNLSAVAALVAVAERLGDDPPAALRVLLVSCGAEEVLQGGIYGFGKAHFPRLDPRRTWFLNLDTIGSPELVLVEGEGPFWMESYRDPSFRQLIAEVAARCGCQLVRGARARSSTDAVIPHRAGYPTATLASWEPETRLLSNYHLMTDTPENLRFETVARAVDLVCELTKALPRTNVG